MSNEAMEVQEASPGYLTEANGLDVPKGYKWTEVGAIPEDWDVMHLSDLGSVVRGGSPRPAGDPRYFGGTYMPWLTVAALTRIPDYRQKVREAVGYLTEEGIKFSRILEPGTLIIANSGATLGVAKILDFQCCANDGIAALINQKAGRKDFLCYFINTRTRYLREIVATGNGQPNLNTERIRRIAAPYPSLVEQYSIAEALSDVDNLIGALDALIAKKRAINQATMQQLLTGKTRLPGFSGAWETKRLGDIGTFSKGRGIRREDISDEGVSCIRYGELYTRYRNYVAEPVSRIPLSVACAALPIKKGDLLFAGSGETAEEIGMCAAYLGDEPAYAGGDIVVLTPHRGISIYLGHLMNHPLVARQKARFSQGDAVVHISANNLAQVVFDLPPMEEQTAIAAVLSDMDAEISVLEHCRDKSRAVKQGMMQQLLTGKVRLV